jgi:hypothetical protein
MAGLYDIFHDSSLLDPFGRMRVSQPRSIFDSKLLHDGQPNQWDDQEVTGSGTTSVHSTDAASQVMSVSNVTAGRRVRQTTKRFNYQPGKATSVFMTVVPGTTATGVVKSWGYFTDPDGLYWQEAGSGLSVVTRTNTSGSPVLVAVGQANFNRDKLDGTGPSGIVYDPDTANNFGIDFQWPVGRIRFTLDVDGVIIPVHEFLHANALSEAFMGTPNQPLRIEIENLGSGPADSIKQISSTVIVEGGLDPIGFPHTAATEVVENLDAGTVYALLGLRLKATHLDIGFQASDFGYVAITGNDVFKYKILVGATVAGSPTWNSVDANSGVEMFLAVDNTNTVSAATVVRSGVLYSRSTLSSLLNDTQIIGSTIDDTPTEVFLGIEPLVNNLAAACHVNWREFT